MSRTRRHRRALLGAAVGAALALPQGGCSRCSAKPAEADAGAATSEQLSVGFPKLASAPALRELDSATGYGVPRGCRLVGKIRRANRDEGRLRFIAGRHELGSLVLATAASDGGSAVARAAFFDAASGKLSSAPWADLTTPPLFDKAASGWVGAWTLPGEPGHTRGLLWRGGESAELLVEGYELSLSELTCSGDDCALLTSLARTSASPGATLMNGRATAPAASWVRTDLEVGTDEPWSPLSIAGFDPAGGHTLALTSGTHVALFGVNKGAATQLALLDAPHGAYDAVIAPEPVVVIPGKAVDSPCGSEEFPLVLLTKGGRRFELRTPAPPESVIARPLARGALLAWVAPVSCAVLERRVVYVTLLGPDGAPVSSPMAVGDGSGFALSTAGDRASIWLLGDAQLSYLEATCDAPKAADAG